MKIRYFLIIVGTFVIVTGTLSLTVAGQEGYNIPQWVKNNAKWWGEGQVSDSDFLQGLQYLLDNNIIHITNTNQVSANDYNSMKQISIQLQSQNQQLQQQLQQDEQKLQQLEQSGGPTQNDQSVLEQELAKIQALRSKPHTVISNDTVNWYFSDSNGNRYHWYIPMSTYDAQVRLDTSLLVGTQTLTFQNGTQMLAQNYAPLAKVLVSNHGFRNVIDQVYDNAGSDEQFIYQVWYITSEMTTYSPDITDSNLTPFEVLTRGEGDCKDKSILIASMLRSSEHTANWKISLEEMDINNPTNPQTMNHMIVWVDTGQKTYAIESTATPDNNGLNVWAGVSISGWEIPV